MKLPNKARAEELAVFLDNHPRTPDGDDISIQPLKEAAAMLRAYAAVVPDRDARDVLTFPLGGGTEREVMDFLENEADALGGAIISPEALSEMCKTLDLESS